MRKVFLVSVLFLACAIPVYAEELQSHVTTELAKVIAITLQEERPVPGTDVAGTFQTLRAEVLEGSRKGEVVTVQNDYLALNVGEKFYALHTVDIPEGIDSYAVFEPYRIPQLLLLVGLFVLVVIIFGGIQGIRGLLALALSFFFIAYLLLPGILHNYSPILVSMGVSSLIIILGSYITHGFNRVTTSAVVGMVGTILITGVLAFFAISLTRLSGFASDEAVYLNFDTAGTIDFAGLLLGAVLIGLLGVLYDASIGQAVAVDELSRAAPHASPLEIYRRALRIGREHIGALVNMLAIAYVGVSLPLLLLFYRLSPDVSFLTTLNREIFATEIVRAMIGGIGIVLAVPITTAIATYVLVTRVRKETFRAGHSKKVR
ncbi:MAG: YibE/F family protein [Patescibacteria group bacterium]